MTAIVRISLLASPKAWPNSYRLFEMLPMMPRFTIDQVRQKLATSSPTAAAAIKVLEDLGIVTELTGQKKTATTATRHTLQCRLNKNFEGGEHAHQISGRQV